MHRLIAAWAGPVVVIHRAEGQSGAITFLVNTLVADVVPSVDAWCAWRVAWRHDEILSKSGDNLFYHYFLYANGYRLSDHQ